MCVSVYLSIYLYIYIYIYIRTHTHTHTHTHTVVQNICTNCNYFFKTCCYFSGHILNSMLKPHEIQLVSRSKSPSVLHAAVNSLCDCLSCGFEISQPAFSSVSGSVGRPTAFPTDSDPGQCEFANLLSGSQWIQDFHPGGQIGWTPCSSSFSNASNPGFGHRCKHWTITLDVYLAGLLFKVFL